MSHEVSHFETEGTADSIDVIAKKYGYSINADALARRVSAHEQARLRSKSKLPPEQIQARFQAYLEQRVGAKMNIRPVTITNIGTINDELKMVEGNSTRQLTDTMTLYIDQDAVTQLQMNTSDFRTDKKIAYLGTDPALSLEERIKKQDEAAAKIAAVENAKSAPRAPLESGDWGEITQVRRIEKGTKEATNAAIEIDTPPKSA